MLLPFVPIVNLVQRENSTQLSRYIDILNPGETRWYHQFHAISAIFSSNDILVTAFIEITENPLGWTEETVTKADGLRILLP